MLRSRASATLALAFVGLVGASAIAASEAADPVAWAFPGAPGGAKSAGPPQTLVGLEGSKKRYTEAQLHDGFRAVDWWPERHPAPPAIVLNGRSPDAMACGYCHLPGGEGRPENAALAGLPAAYIARQVGDMRSGARQGVHPDWVPTALMHKVAEAVTPGEVAQAAAYFSRQTFVPRVRLVEAARIPRMVPRAFVYGQGAGGRVPLSQRIVETPDDFERFEKRDPRVGFTAYVPPGAIERGRDLASTGAAGRTQPCSACHGPRLAGAVGPPIAGRSPGYLFRQLYAFHGGSRRGADAEPMRAVAAHLTTPNMIDLAAYAASLRP